MDYNINNGNFRYAWIISRWFSFFSVFCVLKNTMSCVRFIIETEINLFKNKKYNFNIVSCLFLCVFCVPGFTCEPGISGIKPAYEETNFGTEFKGLIISCKGKEWGGKGHITYYGQVETSSLFTK